MAANVHEGSQRRQAARTRRTEALTHGKVLDQVRGQPVNGLPGPLWIQLRRRHETFCGLVVELLPGNGDRPDMVRADTQLGTVWCSMAATRQCSTAADGLCMCAGGRDGGSVATSGAPARAVPLGNTGTTWVAGA